MVRPAVRGALQPPHGGREVLHDLDAEFAGAPHRTDEEKRLPGRDARADLAAGDDRHRADALLLHDRVLHQPHPADQQGPGRLSHVPHTVRGQGRAEGRGGRAEGEDRHPGENGETEQSITER